MTAPSKESASGPALDVRCRRMLVEAFVAATLRPLVPLVFVRGPGALEAYLRANPDQIDAARRALADCRAEARHHIANYFGWRRVPDDSTQAWSLEDLIEQLRRIAEAEEWARMPAWAVSGMPVRTVGDTKDE